MNDGKVAAWWNGLLSIVLLYDFGWLFRCIWLHDRDGIFALSILSAVLFVFWFITLVNINE